jgi:cytoskeletal protein CcmA (bactofilin family)
VSTERRRAIIGGDLVVQGAIRHAHEVEVWGTVVGGIAADRVVIHPGGRVVGTLEADAADVHGLLDGRVRVRNLISIAATGAVRGDVRYGQLALAVGGDLAAQVRNVPPELNGDFELTVRCGSWTHITSADLLATDVEDGAQHLTYAVGNAEHGFVAFALIFVHDGAGDATAGFDVVVTDGQGAVAGPARRVAVTVEPRG